MKKKLRPVLDGDFWLIGGNPNLGDLQGKGGTPEAKPNLKPQECVDHHVFKSVDGTWHLWGCVRQTAVGRILYHWRAKKLTDVDWEKTGELFRADRNAGESMNEINDLIPHEEYMQSPFVVHENGMYFMFYGGGHTGFDKNGNPAPGNNPASYYQICLMTSPTGTSWYRHRNEQGFSRVFEGPCGARDPMLTKIDGLWHMYFAGFEYNDGVQLPGFYLRTSEDLIHWSDMKLVHRNRNPRFGQSNYDTECPHVVERGGYYYLFRTQDYGRALTHVFRSEDPTDFGTDDTFDKYVGTIGVAAPEIIIDDDGQEYITSNHDLAKGTHMCKLKWVEE